MLTPVPHSGFLVKANPSTLLVPQQYATIQLAVNAASPGDTILVSPSPSGTYAANITINKSLTLMGVATASVIINASNNGPGIIVNATNNVLLEQLTIQDPDTYSDGVAILSSLDVTLTRVIETSTLPSNNSNGTWIDNSNNVIVRNNTITGFLYGVATQGGFSNTIQANNLTRNRAADVFLGATIGNQVKNNYLSRSQTGIDIWNGSSSNIVTNNPVIANNSLAGVYLLHSDDNTITSNNIDFNNSTSNSIGVYLAHVSGNRLYYNNIRHNSIQVFGVVATDLTTNIWNDSRASPKGNYWSFYTGVDTDGDGIGDTNLPWPCPSGGRPCSVLGPAGVDYYPLMLPVNPPVLNVTASASPLSGCSIPNPLVVAFASHVSGGSPPYSYSWNFGDGSSGTTQNVTHSFSARGSLSASVTINDTSLPSNSQTDTVNILSFAGGLAIHVLDDAKNSITGVNITSLSQPPGQAKLSMVSNMTGYSSFPCLPPGPYTIQLSKQGFLTQKTTIIVANSTLVQNITLVRVQNAFPLALLEYAGIGIAVAAILVVGSLLLRRSRRRKTIARLPTKT